jgi:hypothetical protein
MTPRSLPPVLLASALLALGAGSCAGTGKTTSSTARSASPTASTASDSSPPTRNFTQVDEDKDNDVGAPADDTNNDSVLAFGRAASAPDKRAITALIERYYATATAADGAGGCSMLYTTIAEAVPEDYGISPPGPPYARGTTCQAVMTSIFKHEHRQLAAEDAKLRVSQVRLKQNQGLVVLSFGKLPERQIQVTREGKQWKLEALLDSELP